MLTQYQPLELNRYIGSGQPWDLDLIQRRRVRAAALHEGARAANGISGTANAIYQNISFIEQYDPEYVLILSGDHIYKMDYQQMLNAHIGSRRGRDHRRAARAVGESRRPSAS